MRAEREGRGGERAVEGVVGEREVLEGRDTAEVGREWAGEGEIGEVDGDDGAVLGVAGDACPAARRVWARLDPVPESIIWVVELFVLDSE